MESILNFIATALSRVPSVEKAVLFGSRARGDHKEHSDYDVAIFGDVLENDRATLIAACDWESPTLHKIDLVFYSTCESRALLDSIDREGVVFYDRQNDK